MSMSLDEPDFGVGPPEATPTAATPAAASNGAPRPLHPPPRGEVDPDDVADVQRGMTALARLPAGARLGYLRSLDVSREAALTELDASGRRIDRLRFETEAMLESGSGERLGARVLASISTAPPAPLMVGRLDPTSHTILYGPGGAGKGTEAASWILALVYGGHRVLVVDYENHPDEWARRFFGLGGPELMDQVLWVGPLTAGWGGHRGALWQQQDDLRGLAHDFGATVMVVDSIVVACGATDPLKPEAAAQYAGALEYIGRPTLSLAHTTLSERLTYPFGSVFWHNLARVTWSLKREGDGGALLTMRKANNYARVARQLVTTTWRNGLPVEVWEKPYQVALADRIDEVLDRPMRVSEIVAALDADLEDDETPTKDDSVAKALRRGSTDRDGRPPRFVEDGGRWRRCAEDPA